MKKVLIALFVVAAVICVLNEEPKEKMYTIDELEEAIYEAESRAYERGFDEGYNLAKYEDEGELEYIRNNANEDAYEAGYEHGYEIGYEDGYYDCKGGNTSTYDPENLPRIKKDK